MPITLKTKERKIWRKCLSSFVILTFSSSLVFGPTTGASAQYITNLPKPGEMVLLSPAFQPPVLKGMTIHPENPLQFDFIVDRGEDMLGGEALKNESQKLLKYFLAAMTIPDDEAWVNLSPYESDRIIPDMLGTTDMGKAMLEQDYLLKQLSASLTNPQEEIGKNFWNTVYKKAFEKFGTTTIPINTFNKVWIIPDSATVVEKDGSVFVGETHLKVMLDEDYTSVKENIKNKKLGTDRISKDKVEELSAVSSQVVREIIIPELEKEINQGKNFSAVRQMYHSVILATWYKQALKNSLLARIYVDKNKIAGVDTAEKDLKQKIYEQYLEAFRKGVYNLIKEDYDLASKETLPRKYFSGGFDWAEAKKAVQRVAPDSAVGSKALRAASPALAGGRFTRVGGLFEEQRAASAVQEKLAVASSSALDSAKLRQFVPHDSKLTQETPGALERILDKAISVEIKGNTVNATVRELINPRLQYYKDHKAEFDAANVNLGIGFGRIAGKLAPLYGQTMKDTAGLQAALEAAKLNPADIQTFLALVTADRITDLNNYLAFQQNEAEVAAITNQANLLTMNADDVEDLVTPLLDDFAASPRFAQRKQEAEQLFVDGNYVPVMLFAGAATRFGGPLYGVDLNAVAVTEGQLKDGEIKSKLGMGPRQLIAYRMFLEKLASDQGLAVEDLMSKQKMVLVINEEVLDLITNDIYVNNFYGFNPQNLYFIVQPVLPGYDLSPDGRGIVETNEVKPLPYGHGFIFMQLREGNQAFQIGANGEIIGVEKPMDQIFSSEMFATHRINDLTKLSSKTVVELDKVAYDLELLANGNTLVGELVENPGKAKGGNAFQMKSGTPNSGKAFLVEKLNTDGSKAWTDLINNAAEKGAPYNAFRLFGAFNQLSAMLGEGLSYNLRIKEGRLFMEAVTGDVTQHNEANAAFFKKKGEVIKDFKEVKNIPLAVAALRAQENELQAAGLVASSASSAVRPAVALVFEQSPMLANILKARLSDSGYEVEIAKSLEQAKNALSLRTPDLIVAGNAIDSAKFFADNQLVGGKTKLFLFVSREAARTKTVQNMEAQGVIVQSSAQQGESVNELITRIIQEIPPALEVTQPVVAPVTKNQVIAAGQKVVLQFPDGQTDVSKLIGRTFIIRTSDNRAYEVTIEQNANYLNLAYFEPEAGVSDNFTYALTGSTYTSSDNKRNIDGRLDLYLEGNQVVLASNVSTDIVVDYQDPRTDAETVASSAANVGGIDFDPSLLNLQIKRDGRGVPLPLPQQNIETINIDGLYPVIINIQPATIQNFPFLLSAEQDEKIPELSKR